MIVLVVAGAVIGFCQWVLFGRLGEQVVLGARRMLVDRVLRARADLITSRCPA